MARQDYGRELRRYNGRAWRGVLSRKLRADPDITRPRRLGGQSSAGKVGGPGRVRPTSHRFRRRRASQGMMKAARSGALDCAAMRSYRITWLGTNWEPIELPTAPWSLSQGQLRLRTSKGRPLRAGIQHPRPPLDWSRADQTASPIESASLRPRRAETESRPETDTRRLPRRTPSRPPAGATRPARRR